MMAASSDVESELSRLKGEITSEAPKQLEGGRHGKARLPKGRPVAGQHPGGDRPAEPQDR